MTDKLMTTYVVSVFEKPHWRTVLTTKDKAKAEAMADQIGEGAQIEQITPKVRQRGANQPMPCLGAEFL
jgi:hypothetical protein